MLAECVVPRNRSDPASPIDASDDDEFLPLDGIESWEVVRGRIERVAHRGEPIAHNALHPRVTAIDRCTHEILARAELTIAFVHARHVHRPIVKGSRSLERFERRKDRSSVELGSTR